jgi:hypothetical protein
LLDVITQLVVGPWFANEEPNEEIKEEDHEDEFDENEDITAMKVTVEEEVLPVSVHLKIS